MPEHVAGGAARPAPAAGAAAPAPASASDAERRTPRRTTALVVRATPDELAAWHAGAARDNWATTAGWARNTLSYVAREFRDDRYLNQERADAASQLAEQLSRVGNNLNQIAWRLHESGGAAAGAVGDEAAALLDEVRAVLARVSAEVLR